MTKAVIREELRLACEEIADIAIELFGDTAPQEVAKIAKKEFANATAEKGKGVYLVRCSLWSQSKGKNNSLLNANFPVGAALDEDTGSIVKGWRGVFDVAEGVVSKFFGEDITQASSEAMFKAARNTRLNLYRNKNPSVTINFNFDFGDRPFGVVTTVLHMRGE